MRSTKKITKALQGTLSVSATLEPYRSPTYASLIDLCRLVAYERVREREAREFGTREHPMEAHITRSSVSFTFFPSQPHPRLHSHAGRPGEATGSKTHNELRDLRKATTAALSCVLGVQSASTHRRERNVAWPLFLLQDIAFLWLRAATAFFIHRIYTAAAEHRLQQRP